MNTEKQPESLLAVWGKHIQHWQKTELSQSTYCHEQHLNYHRFTYWRRKLSGQTTKRKESVSHPAFVPVQSSPSVMIDGLSLTLSNGTILPGITSSNIPVVKQLLGLLP